MKFKVYIDFNCDAKREVKPVIVEADTSADAYIKAGNIAGEKRFRIAVDGYDTLPPEHSHFMF